MAASAEQVERAVESFRQAAAANQATAAREGCLIRLDDTNAEDVMVTADLHGNRVNFERLVAIADLDGCPSRHLVVQEVCHGGPSYPATDGCMSHLLLEDVAELKAKYPERVHFLMSNHELAELTDFPIIKANKMLNLRFRNGMRELYGDAGAEEVRLASLGFLRSCPIAVSLASGVFICHSLPERVDRGGFDASVFSRKLTDADIASDGPAFQLVWGRDFRPDNARAFAELVGANVLVIGHEPCLDGCQMPNPHQVILDCCNDNACYLIVPASQAVDHEGVVNQISRIPS